MSGNQVLAFHSFRIDAAARSLTCNGELVALPPKAVEILTLLAERRGQTVLKQELVDRVWPDTFIEEGAVAQNISLLRKALADSGGDPQWIRTVPKRGYCFVAPPSSAPSSRPASATKLVWIAAAVLIVVAGSAALLLRARVTAPPSQPTRVLVLPVENLSGNAEHDYVSDGMTEELIAQLSALDPERLSVIARTSAMTYKGTKKSIGEIGQEMRVDYVVESSLRWSGDRLRITSQLVRTRDQMHVWARSYERTARDLLSLQDEVARAVSLQVDAKLTEKVRSRQPLPDAYLPYLEGRYYWNKRTRASIEEAIVHLRRSIAIDPKFARSHAALADCYMSLGLLAGGQPSELFRNAKREVLAALALDPNLAEAHTSLAYLKFWQEWDWPGAETEFQKAIELSPDYATAHQWYAEYLRLMGRFDESKAESQKALELDPLSLIINMEAGLPDYFRHRNEAAVAQFRRAIELDPNFALAYVELGWAYEESGQQQKAIETLEKAAQLDDTTPVLAALGHAYGVGGRRDDALRILRTLEERSRTTYVPPFLLSAIYLALGDRNRTLDLLEQAYREHDWGLVWMKVAPKLDPLRSEPRFTELLRRMKFPAT